MNDVIGMDEDQVGDLEVRTDIQECRAKHWGEKFQIHRGQIWEVQNPPNRRSRSRDHSQWQREG